MFVLMAARDQRLFPHLKLFSKSRRSDWADIARIGLPVAVQNLFFSSLSMIIARLVAGWGDAAVAVQKVGSQIESITWMTADGFSTALNAFVAQNYGAGKYDRIKQGYRRAVGIIGGWGLFTTAVLMAFPAFLFGLFIPDPQLAPMGSAICAFWACLRCSCASRAFRRRHFRASGGPSPRRCAAFWAMRPAFPWPWRSPLRRWRWTESGGASAFPASPKGWWSRRFCSGCCTGTAVFPPCENPVKNKCCHTEKPGVPLAHRFFHLFSVRLSLDLQQPQQIRKQRSVGQYKHQPFPVVIRWGCIVNFLNFL